jgi:hypothetical protein
VLARVVLPHPTTTIATYFRLLGKKGGETPTMKYIALVALAAMALSLGACASKSSTTSTTSTASTGYKK